MSENKIFIVVDSDNLFKSQKNHLDFWIDPGKLKDYISQFGEVIYAGYYASYFDDDFDSIEEKNKKRGPRDKFLRALIHMGYSIIKKPVKHIQQTDGSFKDKASLDMVMAKDILMQIDNYDMLVLVSGDGDFTCILEALKIKGKLVKVISTEGVVSRELRELVGSNFIDLRNIREEIEKDNDNRRNHETESQD